MVFVPISAVAVTGRISHCAGYQGAKVAHPYEQQLYSFQVQCEVRKEAVGTHGKFGWLL